MLSLELATRRHLHERSRRKTRRHWLEFWATLAILAAWLFTYGPALVGGPITYAIVSGQSMEPMLHTGDLVLARIQSDYQVGDIVITNVLGGYVIHKVVAHNGKLFHTQGINNDFADTWNIRADQIVGKYEFQLNGVGNALVYLRTHPLALALGAAIFTALVLIDPRPRRLPKRLQVALGDATRELPQSTRDKLGPLLAGVFVMAMLSMLTTSILLANRAVFYPRIALALGGVVASILAFELIGNWMNGGGDLAEPYRTLHVLRNRLYRTESDLQIPGETTLVKSALELEKLAELRNLPVLHRVSNNGLHHEFILVTDDLNYLWRVGLPTDRDVLSGDVGQHARHRA